MKTHGQLCFILSLISVCISSLLFAQSSVTDNQKQSIYRQPIILTDVLNPFAGWRIITERRNLVLFKNQTFLRLKINVTDGAGRVLATFRMEPDLPFPLKGTINKNNYRNVWIKCEYDDVSYADDMRDFKGSKEQLKSYRDFVYLVSWNIKQLYEHETRPTARFALIQILDYVLNFDRNQAIEELGRRNDERVLIAALNTGVTYLLGSNFESRISELDKKAMTAKAAYDDKGFAARHKYQFTRIAANTNNFRDPIPNTVLSLGGLTGLYGNARWKDDDKFRLNPSLRFERTLFSLVTTKSNFYTIGVAGFYENYRVFKGDVDEIEMSGYGGGLTLNFFTRQKLLFIPSFYVLSLEGGITRLSAEYKPFGKSAGSNLIEVPNIVPYGEFTIHLTPPFGRFGVDMGFQAVFANFKFAQSVYSRERYPSKDFIRVRLGVSWYNRW